MNAMAALLIGAYIGGVLYAGNGPEFFDAAKRDAVTFIPWLFAVMLLILLYQSRGYFGPARSTVAAVVAGGALAVLLVSSDAIATAVNDIGKIMNKA